MIISMTNTKFLFLFSILCIKSIHGSVTNYGTYVTDVVEPAYVQYETVTPVRTFLKYRTYSNYYPVYYGGVYSPYIVRELTSPKNRSTQSSQHPPVLNTSFTQENVSEVLSTQPVAQQASPKRLSSKQPTAPQASPKRLSSKQPTPPQASPKRLSSKQPTPPQASPKRLSSKQPSDLEASKQNLISQPRVLRAKERYIQNWSNYSQSIPFNISLDSNAMIKNAEPFSTYLRTISYTSNSSGLITDYMKKKGLCSGDKNNLTDACNSTASVSHDNQHEITQSSSAPSEDSVPLQTAEIVKEPSGGNIQEPSNNVGAPKPEKVFISQIQNNVGADKKISNNENVEPTSSVVQESTVQIPVIDGDLVNDDGLSDVSDSSSLQNVIPDDSTISSEHQISQSQPIHESDNSQDQSYIVKKDIPLQSSVESSNGAYQNTQSNPLMEKEYILVKVPAEDSQLAVSKQASNSLDNVRIQNASSEVNNDPSLHSASQEQTTVEKDGSSSEGRFRDSGSEAVNIKSNNPEEKKTNSISTIQKVLKFINPLSHKSSSNESFVEASHDEKPDQQAPENVSDSDKDEYQEVQFPINIPADGDFIFYGVLFGVEGTTLQEVKFTGEPDGRVRVGIQQGEFITDAFSLSEGSPITTVWSSNGDEARLLFVKQNGKDGFFLQVDKYKLGIIDKRFLVYHQ